MFKDGPTTNYADTDDGTGRSTIERAVTND